jgi:hypothetical protein
VEEASDDEGDDDNDDEEEAEQARYDIPKGKTILTLETGEEEERKTPQQDTQPSGEWRQDGDGWDEWEGDE